MQDAQAVRGLDRIRGLHQDRDGPRQGEPPIALERASVTHGREFAARDTVIVGDSLLDVECAKTHGIRCLAVATGKTDPAELAAEKPEWLVDDLAGAAGHPAFGR